MASIEPSKLDRMKRSFGVTRQQPLRRDRGDGRGSMDHAAKSRRFCRAFW